MDAKMSGAPVQNKETGMILVENLLEPGMVTVSPSDSLAVAWAKIRETGKTGACVVAGENRVVGFITDGDLIRACMPSETDLTIYDDILGKMDLPDGFIARCRSMKVEDVMRGEEDVVTIDSHEPALKALALMYQHKLRRIPVLNGNELVGTISRGQILSDILIDRSVET